MSNISIDTTRHNDSIFVPSTPDFDIYGQGYIRSYITGYSNDPYNNTLQSIISFLNSNDLVDVFYKKFTNVYDSILSVKVCPIANIAGNSKYVQDRLNGTLAGYNFDTSSLGIVHDIVKQYVEIDYNIPNIYDSSAASQGNYIFSEHHQNFFDYSPYVNYKLYLPFYGTINIDSNYIAPNSTRTYLAEGSSSVNFSDFLRIKYVVNMLTGDTTIYVYTVGYIQSVTNSINSNFIIATLNTNVFEDLPIIANNKNTFNTLNGILSGLASTSSIGVGLMSAGKSVINNVSNNYNVIGNLTGNKLCCYYTPYLIKEYKEGIDENTRSEYLNYKGYNVEYGTIHSLGNPEEKGYIKFKEVYFKENEFNSNINKMTTEERNEIIRILTNEGIYY